MKIALKLGIFDRGFVWSNLESREAGLPWGLDLGVSLRRGERGRRPEGGTATYGFRVAGAFGLREAAPFTMQAESGAWTGLAVDLWDAIAEKNNFSFEYTTYPLAGLLEALESGEIDVAVAPLTITADREKAFDFTLPFMQSGLAIAAGGLCLRFAVGLSP